MHIIDRPEDRKLDLAEFVDHVGRHMAPFTTAKILEHAWALRALANDRDFLLQEILRYGNAVADGLSNPGKGGATIILAEEESFYVRANIWLPDGDRSSEDRISFYSYDLPHDHNYTFLTVGYFGSGYKTFLYEYDHEKVDGVPGEPSHARYAGTQQLTPGKMMLYESGKDIHIQCPPETPSISLNLIIRPILGRESQQYIFSEDASKILAGSTDTVTNRFSLLNFCLDNHDEETIRELGKIVSENSCAKTRGFALSVLRKIAPARAEALEADLPPSIIRRSFLQPLGTEARMS